MRWLQYSMFVIVVDLSFLTFRAVLTLTEPMSSGFGGGCFILIRWLNGSVTAIDGREEAPFLSNHTKPLSRGGMSFMCHFINFRLNLALCNIFHWAQNS